MIHLAAVARRAIPAERAGEFPFTVPVVRSLDRLALDTPVTLFVGENGSGKSTLLEAIAIAAGLPTVGADETGHDATLAAQRSLARALRLSWKHRTHTGFFLRAEDFFGYAKRLTSLRTELQRRLADIDTEFRDASAYARGLAAGPVRASLAEMTALYGEDLDAVSHGQSFLRLFESRLRPQGLYLLDEPEAPLSPQSQLALLAMIHATAEDGGQFIIATHSPFLLAFPGARIFTFEDGRIRATTYETLDHVVLTRDFLNDPARFFHHLLAR